MIEQSLFKSNFLGKDGFNWWIGQVADPDTSGWRKAATLTEKQDCQYYRVKVRILGYHPTRDQLSDADLPYAHVLVPLNSGSGVNNNGETHQIQGGESVFGFFADGDDCQQPIIMGSFYRQKGQPDETFATGEEVTFKRFSGRRNANEYQSTHKSGISTSAPGGKNVATGATTPTPPPKVQPPGVVDDISKALASHSSASSASITPPNPCENNEIARIKTSLIEFMNRMRQIQGFLDSYVNPVFNRLVNLDEEIKGYAYRILGVISGLISKAREYILSKVGTLITQTLPNFVSKSLIPAVSSGARKGIDLIYCLFEKLLTYIFSLINDLLQGLINKLFDVVQCTVDDFLNDMFTSISDFIEKNISPILEQINSIFGGALGSVTNIISQALGYAGIVLNIIGDCDNTECSTPSTWSPSGGIKFEFLDDFSTLIAQLGGQDFGACDNSLVCSTSISLTGGGGYGAEATPIVVGGKVIGAIVNEGGTGYLVPPKVVVEDNCGGYGADLIAIIDEPGGGIIEIIIDDPGDGYTGNDPKLSAGIFMGDLSAKTTSENGKKVTFKVCLLTKPKFNVNVNLTSSNTGEGILDVSQLTFTSSNWNEKQTVTVVGVNDSIIDGNVNYKVKAVSSSKDTLYRNKTKSIALTNLDNDGNVVNPPDLGGDPPESINPRTKCGFIAGVYIKSPGYNYDPENDTVSVYDCSGNLVPEVKIDLVFGPENSIVFAEVRQSAIFCECLPTIRINTRTGSNAILIASMRYTGITPKDPEEVQRISIVDCVSR
ncbi:baseplate hub subunit and tail lysozyme [Synechococcus phage DSL-LC02]|nr:baseplate hub subunit and tail lysozyme [Synechococcus phage DSL-LC02]